MKAQVKVILTVVLVITAAAGAWLAKITLPSMPQRSPASLQLGTRLVPPRALPEFSLIAQDGRAIHGEELAGHWTLMFFGFTHCPGVCPMTLAILADVRHRLDDLPEVEQPRVVFVSLDPERDTPSVVAEYLKRFNPSFIGITGAPPAVDAFASAMGIAHGKISLPGGDYMVDHTVEVLLLDPQAREAALFSAPQDAGLLAADYRRMLGS